MAPYKDPRLEALKSAADCLREDGEDEHADEIDTLIEMFAPRKGDAPETARARTLMQAHCSNCGHQWGAMAMPAPMSVTALAGQRLAQCARCFATEGIMLGQTGS